MMTKKQERMEAKEVPPAPGGRWRWVGPALAGLISLASLAMLMTVAPFSMRSEASLAYLAAARGGDAAASAAPVRPLYPMLIAGAAKLGADPEAAATWIALLAAALTVCPIYGIGRRLGGVGAGVLAAFAYAFLPLTVPVAIEINALPLFGLFTAAAAWATLLCIERPSDWRAGLAGGLAGLAGASLSLGLLLFPVAALALCLAGAIQQWPRRTLLVTRSALGAFLLVAVLAGAAARFSGGGSGWWPGSGDLIGMSDELRPAPATDGLGFPGRIAAYTRAAGSGLPWPFLALVLAGLIARRERNEVAGETGLWLFVLVPAIGYAALTKTMVNAQGLWPAAALASVWAGRAARLPGTVREKLKGRLGRTAGVLAAVLIAAAGLWLVRAELAARSQARLLLAPGYVKTRLIGGQRDAGRDAARLLRPRAGARLWGLTPFFAYYFGGSPVTLGPADEVERGLGEGRADYLVIDSLAAQRLAPGLRPLITATAPIGGAGLVYRRYLMDSDRLVSVFQRGAPSLAVAPENPAPEQAATLLTEAQGYYKKGYVEHARQLLLAAERAAPDEAQPHFELYRVELIYGYYDRTSLDLAEAELMKYSYLAPHDPNLDLYRDMVRNARIRHTVDWGKE